MSIDYKSFFNDSREIKNVLKGLSELSGPVFLYGADYGVFSFVARAICEIYSRDVVVYFEDDIKARAAHSFIEDSLYIAPIDRMFGKTFSQSRDEDAARAEVLLGLNQRGRKPAVLFCSVVCALEKYPVADADEDCFELHVGQKISLSDLFNFLYEGGYEKTSYISQKCEVSVRGGIIDVFSPMHETPVRIELFGDEVASLRRFDIASQTSTEKIVECRLYAGKSAKSGIGGAAYCGIEAYLDSPIVFIIGANAAAARLRQNEEEFLVRVREHFLSDEDFSIAALLQQEGIVIDEPENAEASVSDSILRALRYSADEALGRLCGGDLVITELLQRSFDDFSPVQTVQLETNELYGDVGVVISELRRLQHLGYKIFAGFYSEERLDRFIKLLADRDYDLPYEVDRCGGAELKNGSMMISLCGLEKGVIFPTFRSVVVTEREIFAPKKRAAKTKSSVLGVKAFSELSAGDYVVLDSYGIGIFAGIEQIESFGVRKDYMRINYAGADVLHVPVEAAETVRKYIGGDTEKVKVSKMGGTAWQTQVSKAKRRIEEMADDLIELYARRQGRIGYAYGEDTPWQQEFEDQFPYEETGDQLRAAEEIKRDMQRGTPMDRLLAGDVGYGKTEVALRAAFKAVSESKQVAILVPTTVLAQQHYNNVRERFSRYPVKIEMVSRFRTSAEIKKILTRLKTGEVDILIGTHRLLSKDVAFRDLGLLIVDEEQRFGVRHKESIKKMKENVDVLTLTATPIPRTLHMSILGVRDMSVLEEPPAERSPVQTYVLEYSDALAREAIIREVERRGQVYYVYNRIEGIEKVRNELAEALPGVSFRVAHGRMSETELENIMLDFMSGKFDVLVSTTIIETGLDISNVNTIIVRNADRLGLSQLYQLRGRVGRGVRRGYCYVFFQKGKQLSEVQERRLRAIREFTDLGAGFKIAMKDLEIRGAGNLLGTAQSGFMENIGYDMFLRILDETLKRRRGERVVERTECRVEINVNAYIPEDYVADAQERIDMYKQLSAMEVKSDELLGKFEDRYGKAPEPLANLVDIANIKNIAEQIGVAFVYQSKGFLYLRFDPSVAQDVYKLGNMLAEYKEVTFCSGKHEELRLEIPDESNWIHSVAKKIETVYSYLE